MKKKSNNKRTIFILVPMLGLSLLAFVLTPSAPALGIQAEDNTSVDMKSNYDVDDQKHEAPANHEPLFISVFKFIVNCNPFRKETNL